MMGTSQMVFDGFQVKDEVVESCHGTSKGNLNKHSNFETLLGVKY